MVEEFFAFVFRVDLASSDPGQQVILGGGDLAPKFYPVLSSLQRFAVAAFCAVAVCCGAEPFRLLEPASRRELMV